MILGVTDEDEEEGFLGSIGFMFDAQHVRQEKIVNFGEDITLKIKLIGEDPGETSFEKVILLLIVIAN